MSFPYPLQRATAAPDSFDTALLLLYFIGIYLGLDIRLSANVPVPSALSGIAGIVLLVKNMHRLRDNQIGALLMVIALFLGSILSAADISFLGKRTTGLIQLSYSFFIGYGLYVTMLMYERSRIAPLFGWFSVFILVGSALEVYVDPFRAFSDMVRGIIYDFGVYASDERDVMLYGTIRPKVFTSEPSAVTFGFVLYAFCWYVLSEWRWKLVGYGMMFAAAFVLLRGPTLVLGLALLIPYEMFLAPRRQTPRRASYDLGRGMVAVGAAIVLTFVAMIVGLSVYSERISQIQAGTDPSFFSRITAPALVAFSVIQDKPLAGIGLTGETLIDGLVRQIYAQGGNLITDYEFASAKYALTNYFWTHWIYLGAVWGVIVLAGLTFFLRALNAPSILFCWSIWTLLGQASGAYVSPKTWTVLYLACVISILHQRTASRSLRTRRTVPEELRLPAIQAGWRQQ